MSKADREKSERLYGEVFEYLYSKGVDMNAIQNFMREVNKGIRDNDYQTIARALDVVSRNAQGVNPRQIMRIVDKYNLASSEKRMRFEAEQAREKRLFDEEENRL